MKNIFQWVFVGVLSLLSTVSPSFAQNFPNKPIQIIVPVAAGGGTDLLARTLGQKVSEVLGQPVVIENRLGAGGNIGVEMVFIFHKCRDLQLIVLVCGACSSMSQKIFLLILPLAFIQAL